MKGRKPKPRSLKLFSGTEERYIKNESVPKQATNLRAPSWLPEYGKTLWKQLAPELQRLGLLTELDITSFAALCCCYARARQAAEILERDGDISVNERGLARKHPANQIYRHNWNNFRQLAIEFGLAPSARTRLDVKLPAEESEIDDIPD